MRIVNFFRRWLVGTFATLIGASALAFVEAPVGILGKDHWLFYRYELSDKVDATDTDQSLRLINQFNRVLASNGIALVLAMVPIKMRIYAQYLPESVHLNPYMEGNYERMSNLLRESGVAVADINNAFLNSPKRNSSPPLFYKLDTHWSLTGAMVAAEAVKKKIDSTASLKSALSATPVEGYNLIIGKRQIPSQGRDLIEQLPPNSISFAYEAVTPISVVRERPLQQGLLGRDAVTAVALLGSSYSREWTGFSDALRYVLQRDIFSMGIGADQGSWVGMEAYLRDEAFQRHTPKLLIWELPERDMRAPPNYVFRESRYISDNTEWLLRVSALAQRDCRTSLAKATVSKTGLGGHIGSLRGNDLTTTTTNEGDFLEIELDRPLQKLDYVSVAATAHGASSWTVEGSGIGSVARKFKVNINGDGAPHLIKTPFPSRTNGFTKLRVFPGKTDGIALRQLQICSQPTDLLD